MVTIDTIHVERYERPSLFRNSGKLAKAQPFPTEKPHTLISRMMSPLTTWHAKRPSRLSLRHLTPEQLDDIGLSRCEADAEIEKDYILSALKRLFFRDR